MSKSERRRKFEKAVDMKAYNKNSSLKFYNAGFGKGKINYCPKCKVICRKSNYRNGKWFCSDCNTECEDKERR